MIFCLNYFTEQNWKINLEITFFFLGYFYSRFSWIFWRFDFYRITWPVNQIWPQNLKTKQKCFKTFSYIFFLSHKSMTFYCSLHNPNSSQFTAHRSLTINTIKAEKKQKHICTILTLRQKLLASNTVDVTTSSALPSMLQTFWRMKSIT